MRTLQLALSFVLPLGLFACTINTVDPDPVGNAGNGGTGGSTSSSSSSGTAGTGGDGGGMQQGTAQVRFMNPSFFESAELRSANQNGDLPESELLEPTKGTAYLDRSAGTYTFFALNADGIVAQLEDRLLENEKQYTVAGLGMGSGNPMILFKQDDYTNIAVDHTRFHFVNAQPADSNVEMEVFVLYPNPDMTETVKANFKGPYGSTNTEELAYATTPVHLEVTWPLPNDPTRKLFVTWNIASFVQQNKDSAVDVYLSFTGQCDIMQPDFSTCDPHFIAQGVSGSTGGAILVKKANTP